MNELVVKFKGNRYTSFDQVPLTLNVEEAANVIGCSVSNMYNLMHTEDFPTTIFNKRLAVRKEFLIKYMDAHTRNFAYWDQYEIKGEYHS